jgi:hypothetical protein
LAMIVLLMLVCGARVRGARYAPEVAVLGR